MKKILYGFSALALSALFFTACQKDSTVSDATVNELAVTTSEDLSDADSYTQNTEDEADIAIAGSGAGGGGSTSCAVVTFSAARGVFPQTITIDFGTGCTDRNGRVRKGKMLVTLSDSLTKVNATKTVVFQNFSIDSTTIEGTRTWKYNGLNASGNLSFTRTIQNGKLTFPDGKTASWNGTHTVTKVQGMATASLLDDVWEVTGNASGVNRAGKAFSSVINSPITHKTLCPWITKGVRTIAIDGKTRSLDYGYGGGDCDRDALLTLSNGETKVIKIRK
jgi:hypothetical protein